MAKTPRKLTTIHPIPFAPALFVLGRDIRRVDHETVDPFLDQLVVDPITTIPRFINRIIHAPGKVMSKIVDQRVHLRRLAKAFVFARGCRNVDLPALLVNVQTSKNRLTREIKSVTFNHGKPPFGVGFWRNKIIPEKRRLAFLFLNPLRKGSACSRVIPRGGRERREFSPAPSGCRGACPKGKLSKLS